MEIRILSLFIITTLTYANVDFFYLNENELSFKLCKRPLSVNIFNIDRPCLEDTNNNLYHFQFFLNDNSNNFTLDFISEKEKRYIFIDNSCKNNKFSNFGLFSSPFSNKTVIKCDEKIEDYVKCDTYRYNKDILYESLSDLLNDFEYKQYDLSKYNCQTFAKNIIEIYNYKKKSKFENEHKCYQFTNYKFKEYNFDFFKILFLGCKNTGVYDEKKDINIIDLINSNNIKYKWKAIDD